MKRKMCDSFFDLVYKWAEENDASFLEMINLGASLFTNLCIQTDFSQEDHEKYCDMLKEKYPEFLKRFKKRKKNEL